MLCWAAPGCSALTDLLPSTSPDLQFTCGLSQQCLMTCCCLAFSELAVSVLFPRDGSLSDRKQSLCLAPLWADLAEAMHCPPASLQELSLPSLESCWCDSLWVGIKCHRADFTATALFHPDGRARARQLQVDVWVLWCFSFCLGVLSLLPWPWSPLGREVAP